MDEFEDRLKAVVQEMRLNAPDSFPVAFTLSDHEIEDAERSLGVRFPATYKWFLKNVGHVLDPYDIAGFWPDEKIQGQGIWSVVNLTMRERNDVEPRLAHQFIALTPDGTGNHWCLDTSKMIDDECPVVFWNHNLGEDQEPTVVAAHFLDWLEEHVATTEIF